MDIVCFFILSVDLGSEKCLPSHLPSDFRVIVRISKILQNGVWCFRCWKTNNIHCFSQILDIAISVQLQSALNPYNYEPYCHIILALLFT